MVTEPSAAIYHFRYLKHTAEINNSRELIAQTLAKRSGCLQEDVFALQSGHDDLAL